jgi:RHS repeat-associated protein
MRRAIFVFCLALFTLVPRAVAQTGFPAFGSFEQSGFDAVNRQNLNTVFAIPIMSTAARGQNFQFSLANNSLFWTQTGGTPNTWTPVTDPNGNPIWGWTYGSAVSGSGQPLFQGQGSSHQCRYIDPNTGLQAFASWSTTTYSHFAYRDWIGSVHPFSGSYVVTSASQAAQTYCGITNSSTGPVAGYSTDNTGFYFTSNYGTVSVVSPAGVAAGGAPVDTNGNFVSQTVVSSTETDWTDTAGHLALKVLTNTSNANIQYEWQDSSGNRTSATTTTVLRSSVSIKTNFACTGVTEYTGTATLPTEIDLPNGQKYLITYEPTPGNSGYYTGRVKRITLPTGGYYEYDYPTTAGDGIVCADASVSSLTRVMNDGTNTSTWTFSRSGSATTVVAPIMPYDTAANTAVYTFSGSEQTGAQFYQGTAVSGNLRRTISSTWAANGTPATQITLLEDGHTENEVETSYDNYGNLLSLKEHDWGTNAPGSILRTTAITYLNTSPYVSANILNRPLSVTVTDNVSGVVHSLTNIAYDESGYINYGTCQTASQNTSSCTNTVRGNPTTVTTYTNAAAPSGSILHHTYYDNLGNVARADLDCCQSKTWVYSSSTNFSFPDSSTRGSSPGTQLTSSATYNPYTGAVATSTDENGQVTHYTFDNLERPTNVQRPDSTNLTWSYSDATPPTQSSVTAGVPIQGTNVQNTITTVDGLGRPITQKISDGTTTYSIVATQYDPLGRGYMTSNPYTTSALYWTKTQFDALGRPTISLLQDSSAMTFSYATNTATITDPAGKARKSVADGLGRMTSVYEPDPTNGNSLTVQTSYAYNILDQLTSVSASPQTRTYVYDDLGRVTKTTTPEAGTLCFGSVTGTTCNSDGYDSFGNLVKRTDARGVLTGYGYDNLNRLSTISYNVGTSGVAATSGVTLTYDQGGSAAFALGRLTHMADGVGSETYTYNLLGEMTQLQKLIGTTTYTTGYAHNLAGELSSVTYPSSRVVQQSFDAIGRLCAVGNSGSTCSSGTTFATGYAYNAAFQVTSFNYGNGVAAAIGYTPDRLLLQSLAYTKGSTTLFSTNYWYKTDSTNCPNGSSGNNGQIQCITDNVDSGRTISYGYDALYRLTSATTNGSTNYPKWGLSWSLSYDRYGNRLGQTQTYGAPPTNSVSVDPTTNHITGSPYAYDANGNMTNDGNNTLVYDAENRVLSATNGSTSGTYTYDGNSLRVQKVSGGTTTIYIFSGPKVIAEYSGTSAPYSLAREYIYSGSALLAKIESSATKYYHQDHLSNRLVTDSSGNAIEQLGHYPFGESWYNASNDKLLFTSYERDSESGNDYAIMRSSVNRLARFSSPDSQPGSTSDAQSLNHYTYALNDPANLADPSGLRPAYAPAMSGFTFASWQFDVFLNGYDAVEGDSPERRQVGFADSNGERVPVYETTYPQNANLDVLDLGPPVFPNLPDPLLAPVKQPPSPNPCEQKILDALNQNVPGANLTPSNVQSPPPIPGQGNISPNNNGVFDYSGATNLYITSPQPLPISPGQRWGPSTGPSVHVPRPQSVFDPHAIFATVGGNMWFTAHIDSANANADVVGFLKHLITDVLGHNTRNPCP